MATNSTEILHDFSPLIRVYKDSQVERLIGKDIAAASVVPKTGVQSKDVQISPELDISARLYMPKNAEQVKKLPLLVYFHGGGFVTESAFSPAYHTHLNAVVAEANVVAVSVNYRLASENPVPTAYEESWIALKWVASHSNGEGPEVWLKDFADLDRVYFGGDSAGGSLAHNMALRVALQKLEGINLDGMFPYCPYLWGKEPTGIELTKLEVIVAIWRYAYPNTTGADDPLLNPMEPNLPTYVYALDSTLNI